MKLLFTIIATLALLTGTAQAGNSYTYKLGVDKQIPVNCDNPTAYLSGAALDPADIDHVTMFIDPVNLNTTDPYHTVTMIGGCSQTLLDASLFVKDVKYYYYGNTTANGFTNGLNPSEESADFTILSSPPGWPHSWRDR